MLALAAAVLLSLTLAAAWLINSHAHPIARMGQPIAQDTRTIILLRRTNALALRILHSARPIHRELTTIVGDANGINGTARHINGTAGNIQGTAGSIDTEARSINGTASAIGGEASSINGSVTRIGGLVGSINGTAAQINALVGQILSTATTINQRVIASEAPVGGIRNVAGKIRGDVWRINYEVATTDSLARSIRADTGDILRESHAVRGAAACIDKKLNGGQDPDCPSGHG